MRRVGGRSLVMMSSQAMYSGAHIVPFRGIGSVLKHTTG